MRDSSRYENSAEIVILFVPSDRKFCLPYFYGAAALLAMQSAVLAMAISSVCTLSICLSVRPLHVGTYPDE